MSKYRAVVVSAFPSEPVDGKIESAKQSFHSTMESARNWAEKMLPHGTRVDIYEQTEVLVESRK